MVIVDRNESQVEEIASMTLIKTFTHLPKLFLSEEQRCVALLKVITLIKH